MFGILLQGSHPGLHFFCMEVFPLQILFHFQWSVCSNYFLGQFLQAVCLETYPLLLSCPICWYITVVVFSYVFYISVVSVFLLFHFWFYVGPLSFLFGYSGYGIWILFIFSKNQFLVLLIFPVVSFILCFTFALIFNISSLLLTEFCLFL